MMPGRFLAGICLALGLLVASTDTGWAQFSPNQQCRLLWRKRKGPSKPVRLFKSRAPRDNSIYPKVPARTTPRHAVPTASAPEPVSPAPPPTPAPPPLPPPVSDKHARIREEVKQRLAAGEPPAVESLYFITAQDEFAFLDMDPFLMAAEYAIQGFTLLVEGHTDNRGDDAYNLELSMKRVRRIESLMLEMGVPSDRLSVMGYGETTPQYDNRTEEGRQKNRRVDFKLF